MSLVRSTVRFFDSFRRARQRHGDILAGGCGPDGSDTGSGRYNSRRAASNTANTAFKGVLKARHLQMIAIGGSIGTGLFIGSGKALASAGSASVLLAFQLVGILVYITMQCLAELVSKRKGQSRQSDIGHLIAYFVFQVLIFIFNKTT